VTGVEHLAEILAYVESVVPPGPDPLTHRTACVMGISSAILTRAASLIESHDFETAIDLVSVGNVYALQAYKMIYEDRRDAGRLSPVEILERMRSDESITNTRFYRKEAPTTSAIPPDDLVHLGVIDDASEVQPQQVGRSGRELS